MISFADGEIIGTDPFFIKIKSIPPGSVIGSGLILIPGF
jgi:hypothetical protein